MQGLNGNFDDGDQFLGEPFTIDELRMAFSSLNLGKSPRCDCITAEQIKYAGEDILTLLCQLFNLIRDLEYIPSCFRYGVQVPLFKGKDLCNLDPNNYRGITLLSTFSKLFEITIWNRLKEWWVDEGVISELQGACKSDLSHCFLPAGDYSHVVGGGEQMFSCLLRRD